jgi:aspartyl-tRNA(Asn)/glutamyl-tRNA(Gln) amidotransferase subunit A
MYTIAEQAAALADGRATARALVEACLQRIGDPAGEGARTFTTVYAKQARAMADAADVLRRAGRASRHAGVPISIKDLFDVLGEPTPAGSVVLADAKPAAVNAVIVDRLTAAGFIPVGRTTMSEFAFTGLGINPHHGTPAAPWDRASRRIPGGSSSGAAVSVADGMASGAIGTDTGGSCRIPAAFCGVVGFKPTARRVPLAGALPLSPSLDSIGPLAASVACCATLDAAMAGEPLPTLRPRPVAGLRLLAPQNVVLDGMEDAVADAFEAALSRLSAAGAVITRAKLAAFDQVIEAAGRVSLASMEAYAWHRDLIAARGDDYDPRVRARILGGQGASAADYITLLARRAAAIRACDAETADHDALVMPTVPILPPPIAALDDAAEFGRVNQLVLRNTALANFLDRCAITLPAGGPEAPPVGLMLVGPALGDAKLLSLTRGIEALSDRSPS